MKALRLLADAIRRALKVHRDPVDDARKNVTGGAVEIALHRQRVQCLRNALALAGIHASLQQSTAENKANSLADFVNGGTQHADRNGGIVVQSVQRVVGNFSTLHSGSPVKALTVSAEALQVIKQQG